IAAWIIAILWTFFLGSGKMSMYELLASGFHGPPQGDIGILVVSFICGVFPRTLWQLVAAGAKRIPGVPSLLPGLTSGLPLSELDGVTIWHESRFEEEDVENVANLAGADPLELMLQT